MKEQIMLTPRQSQVLLLVGRGLSNKAIANALHLSESTIKTHVSATMRKYFVKNRTQLALAASNWPH